jgi:hypothetical protein
MANHLRAPGWAAGTPFGVPLVNQLTGRVRFLGLFLDTFGVMGLLVLSRVDIGQGAHDVSREGPSPSRIEVAAPGRAMEHARETTVLLYRVGLIRPDPRRLALR